MERDKKIKIMRIITRLNIGGPSIHALILNEGLCNGEFDSHLIVGTPTKDEGDMSHIIAEKGASMTIIPELGRQIRWWSDLVALWKLYRLIKREKPHIVHTHMAKAGALGRLAAILAGVPVKVHTFHGHVFHSYFDSSSTRAFLLIEKIFAKFTDRIIVVSELIKDEICNRFKVTDVAKASVVRLGLDLSVFENVMTLRGALRKELNIDRNTSLVGIIGRLTSIKNHKLFFDVIKLLKEEQTALAVRFLIVGDGELRAELEEYATALGIKDWVYFIGWRRDMPAVYADLDIVVLTSLNEGTPLSLIEAVASQRAIIATAVGGVPDLVEDRKTGLLVDSNNAGQLKEAIKILLQDEVLRRNLGQAGRNRVLERYSKERLIKDIENIYKELLKQKSIN